MSDTFVGRVYTAVLRMLRGRPEQYLGSGAQLLDTDLETPTGPFTLLFARADRPQVTFGWRWHFVGGPPVGFSATDEDIAGYAGWILVSLQEAVECFTPDVLPEEARVVWIGRSRPHRSDRS